MMQTLARLAVTFALAFSLLLSADAQQPNTPATTTQKPRTSTTSIHRRKHRSSTTSAHRTKTPPNKASAAHSVSPRSITTPAPTLKTRSATIPGADSHPPPSTDRILPDQREDQKAQAQRNKSNAMAEKERLKAIKKSDKAIIAAQSYGAMDVPRNQTVLKH
jgi:hypothetical protein